MNLTSFEDVHSRLESQLPSRILLVHPTKYLGNLLISGNLIQAFAVWCNSRGIELMLILDKQYEDAFGDQFPEATQIHWYPRSQLSSGSRIARTAAYFSFLRVIRRFKADIAFNLEEDSVASTLVRLSGAAYRLGCSQDRHNRGYEAVLPLEINNRPDNERHRWYSYREVFSVFPDFISELKNNASYLNISINNNILGSIPDILHEVNNRPFVIVHAGGSKPYKRWPDENYAVLVRNLSDQGLLPVFIGAGNADTASVARILAILEAENGHVTTLNLCNRLNLTQLMALFTQAKAMVGNDSGPFHLGSALKLPGVVLFGPTETGIWGPLGKNSRILHKKQLCQSDCSRLHCELNYRCLSSISPNEVVDNINIIQTVKDIS